MIAVDEVCRQVADPVWVITIARRVP